MIKSLLKSCITIQPAFLGCPIHFHWSWFLFCLLYSWASWQNFFFFLLFYGIILLHEFGHCWAAKNFYGYPTYSITISPIGGLAALSLPDRMTSAEEFWITAFGPFVNLILVPILVCLVYWSLGTSSYDLWFQLLTANVFVLAFNLLPVFPMDGGRLFRSILLLFNHSYERSTHIAVRSGQFLAVCFGVLCLMQGLFGCLVVFAGVIVMGQAEIERAKTN